MIFKPFLIANAIALFFYGICFAHAETAEFFYNRGRENFVNCDYHLAMENYNQALQLKPDYAEALNGRGEIYLNVSEYADAEKEFSAAIEANPRYETAHVNRGRLYRIAGDYNKAIADWTKALELNPNSADLREKLADLYFYRGAGKSEIKGIDEAIRDLSLACLHSPENAEAWYRLGVLFLYVGSFAEADACFMEVQLILENTHNHENLYFAKLGTRRYGGAL